MAFVQILPIANHVGTLSVTRAYPSTNFNYVELQLNVTPFSSMAIPFSSPSMGITVEVDLQYSSGDSFHQYYGPTTIVGSPSGNWGTTHLAVSAPIFGTTLPNPPAAAIPTNYRAFLSANTTITFGASVQET